MATQLLAKFEENSSTAKIRSKVRGGQVEDSPISDLMPKRVDLDLFLTRQQVI